MADRRQDARDGDYPRRRTQGKTNTSSREGRSSRTHLQGRGSSRPSGRSHRGASSSRTSRSGRDERASRTERTGHDERASRTERTSRSNRDERTSRSSQGERTSRTERSNRAERPSRPERTPRESNSPRATHEPRASRTERGGRPSRANASAQSVVSSVVGTVGGAINRINGSSAAARVDSNRPFVLLLVFVAIAAIFFLRLGYLQVIEASHYSAMAEEARTISFTTTPHRGTIYDRNGTVLAKSVDATTIYANPAEVTDAAAEAQAIANVIGGDAATYQELLSKESTTFVYVKRQADVDAAAEVKKLALDGIYFIADTRREYPCGQIGGQVIGYCNVDGEGITGLELQYNDILSGTPGTYTAERGEGGLPIPGGVKEETPAVDGQDIMISLDIELQEYVEDRVAQAAEDMTAGGGSSVVMDAGTGEIYAIASLPYMDPSDMTNSKSGSDQVKAITQAFEPGSVFKTVSATTILEEGAMSPEDTLYCPAVIEADGYKVSDAHERSDQTFSFRQILDQSSNVGISLSVQKMTDGFTKLYEHIQKYNLCEKTGVDYPGEASGTLQPLENWATITGWNVSFGQGVTVTPLQLVRFYGALANDGVEVTPHFLVSKPQTGEVPTYDTEDVIENKAAIPTITDMLKSVVTDGTGKNAQIEGYSVAGKTSTAEIAEGGVYRQGVYNLCFEGFLPDSSSQLVCFVGLNEVPSQGNVSNVFKDIMAFAIDRYKIQPE